MASGGDGSSVLLSVPGPSLCLSRFSIRFSALSSVAKGSACLPAVSVVFTLTSAWAEPFIVRSSRIPGLVSGALVPLSECLAVGGRCFALGGS